MQARAATSPASESALALRGRSLWSSTTAMAYTTQRNPNSPLFGNLAGGQAHPVAHGRLRWGAQNAVDGMDR